jgi:hypothetical protein
VSNVNNYRVANKFNSIQSLQDRILAEMLGGVENILGGRQGAVV